MSQYLIDQISKTANIELEFHSQVVGAKGASRLEEISILCSTSGTASTVPANALFIFIGALPNTAWLEGTVMRDERGFILSGADLIKDGKPPTGWQLDRPPGLLETNVPGIFVVGDVRKGSVKRVASGVGEGSIAIQFVHQYLGSA
jgi:thioredoxin reductase (NADPH)